ncbi:HU family DNA-binding protein [Pengzhenrongella frigida]|uniref:HU family DNA-binding protein n=1 Tax=Pengzhenrongella frigida TaxID=1259133 RepID=UPI0013ECFC83|nr:HU family DNA-binding protein [Cellulomonas sp. HLT2-17]
MNKTEMLTLLESRLGSRGAAVAALDAVLDEIQHAVASGERVTLTGFGTFERVERPARIGRNPRTGTAIEIPAAATPRFHAGSVLRAAVAGPAPSPRTRAVRTTSAAAPRAATTGGVAAKQPARATTAAAKLAKVPETAKAVKPAKAAKLAKTAKPVKVAKPAKAVKPPKAASATKKSASGTSAKAAGSKKKKK